MHLEKKKGGAAGVQPTVSSLSLPGMARWWCEGRFCSGGMLLLPPTPTSSGHSSQRQAREGASSAGSWTLSLSCLEVSPEDLPTAGLLLLPSALLVPLSNQKPAQFGFQAFPSLNSPSPGLCKTIVRMLRVVEGTSEQLDLCGPVFLLDSLASLPQLSCAGKWNILTPSHFQRNSSSLGCSAGFRFWCAAMDELKLNNTS